MSYKKSSIRRKPCIEKGESVECHLFDENEKCSVTLIRPSDAKNLNRKSVLLQAQGTYEELLDGFPLQHAVWSGHLTELQALLNQCTKDDLMKQDVLGRTCLHYACNYAASHKLAKTMATEILQSPIHANLPQASKTKFINTQDELGETALHLAAKSSNKATVQLLIFSKADVNIKSNDVGKDRGRDPLELIYKNIPEAMLALLDASLRIRRSKSLDEHPELFLDFGVIVGYRSNQETEDAVPIESELLILILQNPGPECNKIILHPLVQLFLFFKWKKIQAIFWIAILTNMIWLMSVSSFLVELYLNNCPYQSINDTDSQKETDAFNATITMDLGVKCPKESINVLMAGVVLLLSGQVFLKEVYRLFTVPKISYYYSNPENVFQLVLIVLASISSIPVWSFALGETDFVIIHPWQYQIAALAVFFNWIVVLCQIGKTPRLGMYVSILLKVLIRFGTFMFTFISVLVAFVLAFSILMPQNKAFHTWPLSLSKVLAMMAGEINYDEVFHGEESKEMVPLPFAAQATYAAFTIIVTIILFNLLIGFTVSDIQGLLKKAKVTRLSRGLEQLYLMECFLLSWPMQFVISKIGRHFFDRFLVSAMNKNVNAGHIPKHLRQQIKEMAVERFIASEPEYYCSLTTNTATASQFNKSAEELKTVLKNIVEDALRKQRTVTKCKYLVKRCISCRCRRKIR